jgi:2-hydroxy-4-carboxymuconate semialdehyde hemiacetal dehydrogenase
MRVAIVGYGAVAAVHVGGLRAEGHLSHAVWGPKAEKCRAFAEANGVKRAAGSLESALDGAEAAIVCSPSPVHYAQAAAVLRSGVPVLVELPACASVAEASALAELAAARRLTIQCAHTSRFLDPYRQMREWVRSGELGQIRQIHYRRSIPPRTRSWTDDAVLHHAAHPLDLLLDWFGSVECVGCAATPHEGPPQDAALLARLPGGAPLTIAISYTSRLGDVAMTVAGAEHTVVTDGFSRIASDWPEFEWTGDADASYHDAVREQDRTFLECVRTGAGGTPWSDTLRLHQYLEEFTRLCRRT